MQRATRAEQNLLAVNAKAELCSCEQAQGNAHNRPAIMIAETEFRKLDSLFSIEKDRRCREVYDDVLGAVVNGDVALLHASSKCLDDVSRIIHENCCMAPVRENLIRPPITNCLAEPNDPSVNS